MADVSWCCRRAMGVPSVPCWYLGNVSRETFKILRRSIGGGVGPAGARPELDSKFHSPAGDVSRETSPIRPATPESIFVVAPTCSDCSRESQAESKSHSRVGWVSSCRSLNVPRIPSCEALLRFPGWVVKCVELVDRSAPSSYSY